MPDNYLKLEQDEKLLEISREHILLLIGKLVIWIIVAAAPVILGVFLKPYFAGLSPEVESAWLLVRDTYLLCALLGLFVIVLIYYLNVHIVTNKRVIDIDQIAITSHHTVEVPVDRIQDVTAEIGGVAGSLLNYGTVTVASAGERSKIVFEKVYNPKRVKRIILDAVYETTGKELS